MWISCARHGRWRRCGWEERGHGLFEGGHEGGVLAGQGGELPAGRPHEHRTWVRGLEVKPARCAT